MPNVEPFALKDTPALIERLLPVQKLSAESYKEQMANNGKTLTALGSYWKGRKPLILAKACVLGCLLPATDDPVRDLEVFEQLMGMDDVSLVLRQRRHASPEDVFAAVSVARIEDYFTVAPKRELAVSGLVDLAMPDHAGVKVAWRNAVSEVERLRLEAQILPKGYRERIEAAYRPEQLADATFDHIWDGVNSHLGTNARSFSDLVVQLGTMRFGERPQVADPFCGSGQIPFEAARLGCDVYASDLNPVACMLTWGAFNIVGGSSESREVLRQNQDNLVREVGEEIDRLGVDTDGEGWSAKAFLYCVEARCPQTGWLVPLMTSFVISKNKRVIAELVPDSASKRYDIVIRAGVSDKEMAAAEKGTVRSEGRGQDPYMVHTVGGVSYTTKISTLRGDDRKPDGSTGNRLRLWEKQDFKPRSDDIYEERLYCVHWMRPKPGARGDEYEFRSVTSDDLERERVVEGFVAQHLAEWQDKGWIPDMRIEPGDETERLYRERGWTHWHHLFNSRQLLYLGLTKRYLDVGVDTEATSALYLFFAKGLDYNNRLTRWNSRWDKSENLFYNQALNTLFNYGTRGFSFFSETFRPDLRSFPLAVQSQVAPKPAEQFDAKSGIFITDPPYGDAVKYEEILEFFIAWLRKNPPKEFVDWIWDSRRALAIKGEDENFRRGMVAAYRRMTDLMPDNGIQVILFTHQSGTIWSDMANIVWASGLHVTAAWYVATETESALREGSYVKGTVLLVCRKRQGTLRITRDDLAWELQDEVESQVQLLTGLNQQAKDLYRDENVFEDADLQMAGYAAALRVLTRYAVIDGREMASEASRPRVKGQKTFVDGLIDFAVSTANQYLVPKGTDKRSWDRLSGPERFYLKMLDMESHGASTLDNYQNFAKAFKVRDFRAFMASQRANRARLKGALDFGRAEMGEGSEFGVSALRPVLYAVMELIRNVDGDTVLAHLSLNVPNYYSDGVQRDMAAELAGFLANRLDHLRPDEASAARVLRELIKNQRLG
ncbi:MAG: DUF1156 domain-containing protein [Thermaerobacter sp.]|nr:DUF1156 domain-containing protein [Thermaerobacter sp.]